MSSDWQTKAQAYKDSINAEIKPEWWLPSSLLPLPHNVMNLIPSSGLFTERQLEILSLDATALRDALAARTCTALEVAETYCAAAAVIHQATNCLMDFFPDQALERAKLLDDEYERTGKPVGAMHGVPVTVKDIIALKGRRNTMGFLSRVTTYDYDAPMVAMFRAAGAVFYCKTTCPQAVMHLESDSFLGPTLNPYDTRHTAGGSSGGESAMLAAGASPIGIGTDIGGSIRSPAALCGIYGFKPTVGRLPTTGSYSPMTGQQSIIGTLGPMARSSRDLSLFINTILDSNPWELDQTCVRMPWRPEDVAFVGGTLPRVGVLADDGVVMPVPPMKRALETVVESLKGAGVVVVEVASNAFDWKENWEIARRAYFTDAGKRVREAAAAGGEPILPLTQWIMDQGEGELSASEIIDLSVRRSAHQAAYHAWFASLNIDVLLCPPAPGPAPELGTSKYWGYTSMFNVLDVPAGVFPTGLHVEQSDGRVYRRAVWNETDGEVWEAYSPDKFLGLPLALQVAGRKWEDEKVMRALEVIDEIVHRS